VSDSISIKEEKTFFHTYHRLPIEVDHGQGVYLFSKDGKKYADFFGGIAVNALGYNHPKVNEAIDRQVKRYIHLSNYFLQDAQIELAERILKVSGFKRIFFSNSGTEAMEGAIKLARKWGRSSNKSQLINLTNSFHGRTMGALSLTDRPKYRDGYEPFLQNTVSVEFNNVGDLNAKINGQTLAVIVEFIQGEGGINVVSSDFASELNLLQQKFGFLLIADEIQAGAGRTGRFFGFEHFQVNPDIVLLAKAIGGGLPLGAILGNEKVEEVFGYGAHGTTFGGNPVACAAGCAVMEEIIQNGLMKKAEETGKYLISRLVDLRKEYPSLIKEIRGKGLMIGIDLDREGQPVVDELMNRGFLINCTNNTVLRLLPPYIVNTEECDFLIAELKTVLSLLKK
jgi:acetylornithine/N-succinyldiaminopimelate aminotransferase